MRGNGSVIKPTYDDYGQEFDLFSDDYVSEQEALNDIVNKAEQHGAWQLENKELIIIPFFVVTPPDDVPHGSELASGTIVR